METFEENDYFKELLEYYFTNNKLLYPLNFAINSFALSMFIPMLQGAYPTILPHLIVLLTIPILIVQFKMYKKYWP